MNTMNRCIYFVAGMLLFAGLISGQVQAKTPDRYQVELILFAYPADNTDLQHELWPIQQPDRERYADAYVLAENTAMDGMTPIPASAAAMPDFTRLPVDFFMLDKQRYRLFNHPGYIGIAHMGWVQSAGSKKQAKAVWLAPEPAGNLAIEGTISLHKGRFLHVDVDLWAKMMTDATEDTPVNKPLLSAIDVPAEEPQNSAVALQPERWYRLREKRKIRAGVLQYFDHPAFGMLMRVQPLR